MSEWKPGTVAKATVDGREDVTVLRYDEGWAYVYETGSIGWTYDRGKLVTDVRPLVVLDPGPDVTHTVKALRDTLPSSERWWDEADRVVAGLTRQIEEQTKRPRPLEPAGLGAVVANAKGHKFVRVADPLDGWAHGSQWQRIGGNITDPRNFGWPEVDAVEVLSEGLS